MEGVTESPMLVVMDGSSAIARDRRRGAPLAAEIAARCDTMLRVDGPDGVWSGVRSALAAGERYLVSLGAASTTSAIISAAWSMGLVDAMNVVHVGGLGHDAWSRAAGLAATPDARWGARDRAGVSEVTTVRVEHSAHDEARLGVAVWAGLGDGLMRMLDDDEASAGAAGLARRAVRVVRQTSALSFAPLGARFGDRADAESINALAVSCAGVRVGGISLIAPAAQGVSVVYGALPAPTSLGRGPAALRDAWNALTREHVERLSGQLSAPLSVDGWPMGGDAPASVQVSRGPVARLVG